MTLSEAIEKTGLRSEETARALIAYVNAIVRKKYHADRERQGEMLQRCVVGAYEALVKNGKKKSAEAIVRVKVSTVFAARKREREREKLFAPIVDVEECALATGHDLLFIQIRDDVLDRIGITQKCRARKMSLDVLHGRKEISSYSAEDQRIIKTFVWRVLHYVYLDPTT